MAPKGIRRGVFILLAILSLLLSVDLLVLDSFVLEVMNTILAQAYRGESLPIVNLLFDAIATDAYKTSINEYRYKLFYLYQAIKVPLMALAAGVVIIAWPFSGFRDEEKSASRGPRRLAILILWILTTTLLVHVQIGRYIRFMSDDYCMAAETVARGIIGATVYWYKTLISRYSTNLLLSIEGALGPRFVPLYPALILFAWSAVTTFAVSQVTLARTKVERFRFAALLSVAAIFATLQTSRDLPQSLYWAAQMGNMLPPLVLLAISVGLLARGIPERRRASFAWVKVVAPALLAFFAGGFSEAFTAMQVSFWALILVLGFTARSPRASRELKVMMVSYLLGSLVALALHLAAPGFDGRLRGYTIEHSFFRALEAALLSTSGWLRWVFFSLQRSLSLLGLLFLSFLAGGKYFESHLQSMDPVGLGWRTLIMVPVVTMPILYASFVPAAYAYGGTPPGRHLIIPAFILSCAVAIEGVILGQLIGAGRRTKLRSVFQIISVATLALFLFTSVRAMYGQLRLLKPFAEFAAVWDSNEKLIRAALDEGNKSVTIASQPNQWWNVDRRDIGADPNFWVNQCASRYYGIEVIAHDPPLD